MNWIRNEAKRLSLLALFALAIQFGLCFGHTHADFTWPSSTQQTIATSSTSTHGGGTLPDEDELCPICRASAMITAAAHAPPPALPVPVTFSLVAFAPEHDAASSLMRFAAFHSRGPPLA